MNEPFRQTSDLLDTVHRLHESLTGGDSQDEEAEARSFIRVRAHVAEQPFVLLLSEYDYAVLALCRAVMKEYSAKFGGQNARTE